MAKKVRKIPATLNQFTSEPVAVRRKKKVAGYARVSTDREEQATSYEAQMTYYTVSYTHLTLPTTAGG